MNLIVDIGNSSSKLALFKGKQKLSQTRITDFNKLEIKTFLDDCKIEKAIISSTRELPERFAEIHFPNISKIHYLSHESLLPFKIEYDTPLTLGTDRIAAVAGALLQFPDSDLLVIDAGTAITFDYVLAGSYKGGNISPGINMRFRALNKFTDRLPLVHPTENFSFPGRNTNDAIAAGVITGVTYEINEYIRTFENKITDFKIILTGGDSEFLKDKIDHHIAYLPDIVIDGLNYILEYNAK